VPVVSWFDDSNDRELLDLIPFFEELAKTDDIFSFILNASLPIGLAGGGGGSGGGGGGVGGGSEHRPPTAITQYQQSDSRVTGDGMAGGGGGGGSYCLNE